MCPCGHKQIVCALPKHRGDANKGKSLRELKSEKYSIWKRFCIAEIEEAIATQRMHFKYTDNKENFHKMVLVY